MNIHLAGAEGKFQYFDSVENSDKSNFLLSSSHNNYLVTFAYFAKINLDSQKKLIEKLFRQIPFPKKIILDSGAFSIATGKIKFSVKDYADFLEKYSDLFFAYITLDLITFSSSKKDIEKSIEQTEFNLNYLESRGLSPIPVYQQKWNRFDILEKLLQKYDYICIGGLVTGKISDSMKLPILLDKVFEINSKYKKKIHGLGVTSDLLLKKYPFYSVDSTSWLSGTKQGSIYESVLDRYKIIDVENCGWVKKQVVR